MGYIKNKENHLYNQYRKELNMPNLTEKEIDEMRKNIKLIAMTICEHVWKKKFH